MKKSVVFFALAVLAAQADVITFKSGSKLTGTVSRIEGGNIIFVTDDIGEVKINASKIASMITDKNNTIVYNDKTREEAVIANSNGVYTASGKVLDMGKVKAVNPEEEKWHGSVNLSAGADRGNTVGESVTILADVNRRWEKDRFTASTGYFFAQSGDSRETKRKTSSRFEITGQEDHFWNALVYSYLNGKYEFDRIMSLDHRYRIGAGLGLQWLDGRVFESLGKFSFNQELGAAWVKERYKSSFDDDYWTLRYAHHLTWDPGLIKDFQFTHNFEYLPDFDDWAENYLIDADFGFTYLLIGNWQLIGRAEWDYKKKVGEGAKHSDLRYVLGLGYKW